MTESEYKAAYEGAALIAFSRAIHALGVPMKDAKLVGAKLSVDERHVIAIVADTTDRLVARYAPIEFTDPTGDKPR